MSKNIEAKIKKSKHSWVAEKIKHFAATVWKKLTGQRWKKVPEEKMARILDTLSDKKGPDGVSPKDQVKGKLEEYNAAIKERKALKEEWRQLTKSTLEYKYDFREALQMFKATAGKGTEIPHQKGLIFAVPTSDDGKQKKYVQLDAGSEAGNLKVAEQIGKELGEHPSFQKYTSERKRIEGILEERDKLLEKLERLEGEIPGLVKKDAKQRRDTKVIAEARTASEAKQAKFTEIDDQTRKDYDAKETKLKSDKAMVAKRKDLNTGAEQKLEKVRENLEQFRSELKMVSTDLEQLEKTQGKVSKDSAADIHIERLVKQKKHLEKSINDLEKKQDHLLSQVKNRSSRIKTEEKVIKEEQRELDGAYKRADAEKKKVAKDSVAALNKEVKRHKKNYKDEVADVRSVVSGRPGAEKDAGKATGKLPAGDVVEVSDMDPLLADDQLDQSHQEALLREQEVKDKMDKWEKFE